MRHQPGLDIPINTKLLISNVNEKPEIHFLSCYKYIFTFYEHLSISDSLKYRYHNLNGCDFAQWSTVGFSKLYENCGLSAEYNHIFSSISTGCTLRDILVNETTV